MTRANPLLVKSARKPNTYIALADNVACAQNKQHISILNAVGSGKKVKIHKLLQISNTLTAVTGVGVRYDVKKITAHSVGTSITPEKMDSSNAELQAEITVRTGATVTEGNTLFPITLANDEILLTGGSASNDFRSALNYLPDTDETQKITLREGEGLTVKQITNSAVGAYNWIIVFTVENASEA